MGYYFFTFQSIDAKVHIFFIFVIPYVFFFYFSKKPAGSFVAATAEAPQIENPLATISASPLDADTCVPLSVVIGWNPEARTPATVATVPVTRIASAA